MPLCNGDGIFLAPIAEPPQILCHQRVRGSDTGTKNKANWERGATRIVVTTLAEGTCRISGRILGVFLALSLASMGLAKEALSGVSRVVLRECENGVGIFSDVCVAWVVCGCAALDAARRSSPAVVRRAACVVVLVFVLEEGVPVGGRSTVGASAHRVHVAARALCAAGLPALAVRRSPTIGVRLARVPQALRRVVTVPVFGHYVAALARYAACLAARALRHSPTEVPVLYGGTSWS